MSAYQIKTNFPIFTTHPNLVYLDSAASSQTPEVVLSAMDEYYRNYRANTHRGVYALSDQATTAYNQARAVVAEFIHAAPEEVVFTSGTTHSLNMLASGLCATLTAADNVVVSRLEHHANLIPWQEMSRRYGFALRFIEITTEGRMDMESAAQVIDAHTKVVSAAYVSNVFGTIAPVAELTRLAHAVGAMIVLDAAQAVAHLPIDVKKIDCDFLVFSGHKMYGPTGTGVLYGKKELLEKLPPFMVGGDMIREVSYERATWADAPQKFEAGTQNIAGVIGLGAAAGFLGQHSGCHSDTPKAGKNLFHIQASQTERSFANAQDDILVAYALEQLQCAGVTIVGPADTCDRVGVISFNIPGVHPHDVAEILARRNIAVRAGHHCAMPLMKHAGLPQGTVRASFGVYTTTEDIDKLVEGIEEVKNIFKV